jgi:hypothetical protein
MTTLNESQNKVFRQVILLHKSSIGKIAQATGMHRQSVKIILKTLIEKGFIGIEKSANKQLYFANELKKIKDAYFGSLDEIKKQLPLLRTLYEGTKNTQIINALTGKLGLRTVLLDEIIKGKPICSFHLAVPKPEFEEEYRHNDRRRVELKIPLKILSSFKTREIPLSTIRKTNKKSNIEIFVYGNKVTIFYMGIEAKIFTVKINELTRLFQNIFDSDWRQAKD